MSTSKGSGWTALGSMEECTLRGKPMKVIQLPERPRSAIDLKQFQIRPDTIKMDSGNLLLLLTSIL